MKQLICQGEPKNLAKQTQSLGERNIEDFIVRVVAMKTFFMNEIYELKLDIESLKQKVY